MDNESCTEENPCWVDADYPNQLCPGHRESFDKWWHAKGNE